MLTDSQCRNAKCKDKPYKLTDANGLYLEIKPNGVKAWRYRFKLTKGEGESVCHRRVRPRTTGRDGQ